MQKLRPFIAPTIAALFALLAADAMAIGFGKVPDSAILGQPLDFAVPLRLDVGESIESKCVSAEVSFGDQRVSPQQVQARIEGVGPGALVRVATYQAVNEPVVAVNVSVGCPMRMTRRFVLFADPLPTVSSAPLAYAPEPANPLADAGSRVADAATGGAPASAALRAERPPRQVVADAPRKARPKPKAPPRVKTLESAANPPASTGGSRLRLDADDSVPMTLPDRAQAAIAEAQVAQAAAVEAAARAASAASAAADRVAALEKALEKLSQDTKADREVVAQMRLRTAEAEFQARLMPYLLVLVLLLLLLVAWLFSRLRTQNRELQQEWLKAAKIEEAATVVPSRSSSSLPPDLPSQAAAVTFIATRPGSAAALTAQGEPRASEESAQFPDLPDSVAEPEPWAQRTQRLPPKKPLDSDGGPSRAVSIEELIDLEQQAEFFIVLGQEEAAVDLLVEHLRSTGGVSPLPYLKLLEIYRRRNEREAYDRTRARFNHRFNAVAPDWDDDLKDGRSLEDYPNIIARLQMAWSTPLDAMAELESLLFRKSRGELFDMPAYRDLLFLYSLCRDLMDREPVDSGNVDVLLPLSEGATFTQPMPLEDSPEGMPSGLQDFEGHPTVPVDLDLTQPVMPDSIFGDPLDPPLRRR